MKSGGTNDVAPVAVTAGIVAVWELAVVIFQIPGYVLPSPIQVAAALIQERGTLASHGLVTVAEALTGIAISLVFAVILGVVMDCFPLARRGIYPILVATQTVPMIVMAPILIIYMGFGVGPKILTVVLMCFFPVAVSFCDGLAQVDEEYVNLVRSYGAGRWKAYRLVKIPASVPALISGLKVAATYSISGAVVGEWIGAQKGLGYYLLRVKNGYMLDKVFACVAVIVFLSLCMNGVIRLYQRMALPYLKGK
ncbi:MAG: ABC transporter permease [Hungatella sp.]|jgi:ABC-type nitrate/sulfonate/bicarbonate transport system permease component|nr:ABC transporter permease [Hungatella sp.]